MQLRKSKRPYIVYLNKSKIIWAGESLKNVIPVEFAQGVFSDLEFPNIRNLDNQVLTMVEKNNLKPSEVIIILSSDVFFSQQFASQAEEEMKSYLSIVPFDNVISKRFQNASGQQVVAISQDLINPLVEVFKHHGFEIIAILPDFSLGESLKTEEQFVPELVNTTIHSFITLLPFSFYSPPKPQDNMTSIRDSEGKIFSPRLILMIVFFIALIGILVSVLFANGYLGKQKKTIVLPPDSLEVQENPTSTQIMNELSTASESAEEATDSGEKSSIEIQETISIEVLNGSGIAGQADEVKVALTEQGFTNIKTGNSSSSSQKTIILYDSTVSSDTLQAVVEALEGIGISNSAQENPDLTGVDIRIMTGKE